jgi:hypothetical protein
VIRALQRTTIDPAERKPYAAVHAQVLPGERPSVGLPDDDVLTKQPCADEPALCERVAAHDRMPIVDKDGIGDHAGAIQRMRALRGPKDGAPGH